MDTNFVQYAPLDSSPETFENLALKLIERIQRDFYLVRKKIDFTTSDKSSLASHLLSVVCSHFDVDPNTIATKSCKGDLVKCRFIFYYLADKYYPMIPDTTLAEITGRTNTNVLMSIRSVKKKIASKKDFQTLVGEIEGAFLRERNTNEFYKNLKPIINGKENDSRHNEYIPPRFDESGNLLPAVTRDTDFYGPNDH